MGNIITNERVNKDFILLSNRTTGKFIDVICIASADIADESYQKDIMIWFAQRDWNVLGMGVEGFDICEIIWDKELFDKQKQFIITIIDNAINKHNLELLDYDPFINDYLLETLVKFRQMISEFTKEDIDPEQEFKLFEFDRHIKRYEKCSIHHVCKHAYGCVICGDSR